ncbi:MAG: hypothetical protein V4844_18055 [Pseudomonadota bacterium]
MRLHLFVTLAGALFATTAFAQAEPDVMRDGAWTATVTSADGRRQVARLELRQFTGTWHGPVAKVAGAKGGCTARRFPVTVQQSNASGLAFTVFGDQVSPACANLTVETTPVREAPDRRFEGTVDPGGRITLVRR